MEPTANSVVPNEEPKTAPTNNPAPVMDVVPPKSDHIAEAATPPANPTSSVPAPEPVSPPQPDAAPTEPVEPPAEDHDSPDAIIEEESKKMQAEQKAHEAKPPKQHSGVAAIWATVIIVIVLGGLATYAYLKTK